MRITVIGSSDAFNSAGRCHSCYWLEGAAKGPIMVDFGATALFSLKRLGKDPRALRGIAITHLHGDHVGGLPYLFIDGMFNQRRSLALEILGPQGVPAKAESFFRCAYGELADRDPAYELRIRELLPGDEASLCGVSIRGFAADHMDPPDRPLCLRLRFRDGKQVAFSGDTAMCDELLRAAEGVDLLVAECTARRHPAGRHCTWEEWMTTLPHLSAKRVLLTHLNDEMRASRTELLAEAAKVSRTAELGFAEDGLVVDI